MPIGLILKLCGKSYQVGTFKLRILLVSSIYPPDIGGPATFIPEFASYLQQNGCKVTVVTLSDSISGSQMEKGIEVNYIKRSKFRLLRVVSTVKTLVDLIPKNDFLLCNGLYFETAISLKLRPHNATAKVVGDLAWERYKNRGGRLSIEDYNKQKVASLNRRVFSWSLSQFQNVYSPSVALSKIIDSWEIGRKASVIENGVKCSPENTESTKQKYDVATITRLVPWKNNDLLIRACKILNCKLVIVGDGPEMQNLVTLAADLSLNVTFTGQVGKSEINLILAQSKIFALVSSYEGQSFALTEAMMAGKPVLVSGVSGNASIVRHEETGLICEIDEKDISLKIARLLTDINLAIKLGRNAKSFAETNFCSDKQFEKAFRMLRGNG